MDNIKNILIKSFDEKLSPEEQKQLDATLKESSALREEKRSLEEMRTLIGSTSFQFAEGFSDRVMSNIEKTKPEFFIGFYNAFVRVAIAGVAAIFLILLAIYFVDGSITLDSLYGIAEYAPEETELNFFELAENE